MGLGKLNIKNNISSSRSGSKSDKDCYRLNKSNKYFMLLAGL